MLPGDDLVTIVTTTLLCTAAVVGGGALVLRVRRRGSIMMKVTVVLVVAIVAVVISTIAAMIEMFIGAHDLVVLCWVIGVAAVTSTAAAWLMLHRTVQTATRRLVESARQIAAGGTVSRMQSGWREFDRLSDALADTAESLVAARAEVQRLEDSRRQFFAWISHDLRTPLAGIRAMSEALQDGIVAQPGRYISLIRAKVDTVDRMVDDLFELSSLQGGTWVLRPQIVTVIDLVSDAVVDVRHAASARGITIDHSGIEGHQLWADPRELTRAIGNLLANGVRHAPQGSSILVSAHRRDDDHLVLSIFDHGSGVAVEDLGRMFEVGWRADAARSSDTTGTAGAGLGLAIVRGIVEAHGGEVSARREADGFGLDLILPAALPTPSEVWA